MEQLTLTSILVTSIAIKIVIIFHKSFTSLLDLNILPPIIYDILVVLIYNINNNNDNVNSYNINNNNNNNKGDRSDPWWKRQIESNIKNLKKDADLLEREKRRESRGKRKETIKELDYKYRIKEKGLKLVIQELK